MSDNDKFNECLDCPGCSGDCGQGCGSCPENLQNLPQQGSEDSQETAVSITLETSSVVTPSVVTPSEKDSSEECRPVDINPMDLDEVAEKTEDLRPKVDPSRGKLDCFNYLADIPGGKADYDIVEVQFKNTRKGFYRNSANLDLKLGDMVAVESQPGHDIGRVTLVGHLVRNQMKKAGLSPDSEIRKIFRFARPSDMEKYYEAKALEIPTMIGSRQIAAELGLKMKIGDVEYQGDGLKAIFYYIADERVDFRQLIKILAERFKIRVEMRQIGARQEAGRIGGIGPCGRPLCCSTWMTNFVTVATSAARHQDLSLNPQKLAGQCAKLKCCLNFEIDTYLESVKNMPPKETRLETLEASWYHFKTDIFKGEITYSSDKKNAVNTVTITAERAFEIIEMNNRGEKPVSLIPDEEAKTKAQGSYNDILGDDSQIGRFDKKKKKKKKKKDKEAAAAADSVNDSSENQADDIEEDNVPSSTSEQTPQLNNAPKAKDQAKSKNKNKDKENAPAKHKAQEEAPQNRSVEPSEPTALPTEPHSEYTSENVKNRGVENTGENDKEAKAESEPKLESEPKGESESKSESEPKTEAKTETNAEVKSEANVKQEAQTSVEVESASASKSESAATPIEIVHNEEPGAEKADEEPSKANSESDSSGFSKGVVQKPSHKAEDPEQIEQVAVSPENVPVEKETNVETSSEDKSHDKIEAQPEHKHHNHQSHHNYHNHDHNVQQVNVEGSDEVGVENREQPRKGNNPNKPQWQGKNREPGKGFKPQQGNNPDQPRNPQQGKGYKPQQGRGSEHTPNGQGQHGQPHHQHGPKEQGQGKEPFKPKGQNPPQDRRNNNNKENPGNQGKVFKPQQQGDQGQRPEHPGEQRPRNPREGQQPHPNQGQNPNAPKAEFQNQGSQGNKKKKKKPYPSGENAGNLTQQPFGQGEQGPRPNHQGHHNPNRPPQGPRPNQNPRQSNPNPGNGNGE